MCVSLPANVAVTVYVPATRPVILSTLKVTLALITPFKVPLNVAFPPTTNVSDVTTSTDTSTLALTVALVVAVVALKLTLPS